MNLDRILKVAVRGGASDVILKTGSYPRFRYKGELVTLSDGDMVTAAVMKEWIETILPQRLHERLTRCGDADFAYASRHGYRFRVNAFRQRSQHGIVARVLHSHIKTIQELQLPKVMSHLALEKRGLVLVTGATGSGKSTSLAAMIQDININRAAHIVTIEDPIEFNFQDERSTIQQREVGTDTESFESALRAALRQNPDVILVGELRDAMTTNTALQAAETGHLVLATLHTSDAVESLSRLLSYFEPERHPSLRQLLSHTLKAVISQRLVARADGTAQVAATEVMITNSTIRDIILEKPSFHAIDTVIKKNHDGMHSFDQSLLNLCQQGIISPAEALKQASSRHDMQLAMRGVAS